MELFDLTGKVAVVTGGNGGIGLGMARGLARAGASIAVVGRDAEKSARAVSDLEATGAEATAASGAYTLPPEDRAGVRCGGCGAAAPMIVRGFPASRHHR